MTDINVGDIVRLKNIESGIPGFVDENGTLTDPGVVRLAIRRSGEPPRVYLYGTNVEVVKDATGVYHLDYTITKPGTHYYRWEGSDGLTAAEESSFTAASSF